MPPAARSDQGCLGPRASAGTVAGPPSAVTNPWPRWRPTSCRHSASMPGTAMSWKAVACPASSIQQVRIDIVVEVAAFERIAEECSWRLAIRRRNDLVPLCWPPRSVVRLDRPAALCRAGWAPWSTTASAARRCVSTSCASPPTRLSETRLQYQSAGVGERVRCCAEVAATWRALPCVVNSGTARRTATPIAVMRNRRPARRYRPTGAIIAQTVPMAGA